MSQETKIDLEKLEALEQIVEELEKSQPDPNLVKSGMKALGLDYQDDDILNIDQVLREVRFFAKGVEFEKDK